MTYVTLTEGAFSDESVIGRTVKVEAITIEGHETWSDAGDYSVFFEFTWAENPYDMDTVSAEYCRTSTPAEIAQARIDYANEGKRFTTTTQEES